MLDIFIAIVENNEEKDKLTQIYDKYYGTMIAVAKSIISNHVLAEDAVSNAIIKIIDNLPKIGDISSHKTKAYIIIIVRSTAIDLLRKENKYTKEEYIDDLELPDTSMTILENLTMKESYDDIIKHIMALPKILSDVLYLSAVFGYSNIEISNLLSISEHNVRKRLSRAKAQVKITLAQGGIKYAEK